MEVLCSVPARHLSEPVSRERTDLSSGDTIDWIGDWDGSKIGLLNVDQARTILGEQQTAPDRWIRCHRLLGDDDLVRRPPPTDMAVLHVDTDQWWVLCCEGRGMIVPFLVPSHDDPLSTDCLNDTVPGTSCPADQGTTD